MDNLGLVIEALKFFAKIKGSAEGMSAVGTVLASSSKAVVYVIQKGARLVSYLLTRNGKPTAETSVKTRRRKTRLSTKADVAIVVDINRRSLTDVANYLDANQIDADLIIVTNDPAYKSKTIFLKPEQPEEWVEMVREFSTVMDGIKQTIGATRLHIFLSTPNALAFAMGAVRGLVDEGTMVYHWEDRTYYPVVELTRELRQ